MTSARPIFLYLHGFASSPASAKARAFQGWADGHGLPFDALDLRLPSLEKLRFSAMTARVTEAIDAAGGPRARAVLIGSSLGGLTACRVAESEPRVSAVFLMAPAFQLAQRWREHLGDERWEAWRTEDRFEVMDHATKRLTHVHFRFVAELAAIDEALGPWPDLRIPVRIVHGRRDETVAIERSRAWVHDRPERDLLEVDDDHELGASLPRILAEADAFFAPYVAGKHGPRVADGG